MRYISSTERISMKRGQELGLQLGLQLIGIPLLHRQLRKRFGELPDWVETRLQEATTAQLELWAEQLLDAETLEGVFQESR
ncbi:DUF4351 domain-containing protein [Candidatus Contendibacter odensensis]|uniref:Transposase n=1 Tax=Candidatus Contendobacter odensis Run_B_J11 TaxID=1400861 RepID=A0A7U7J4X5_9GAMM|nr:DUF4351 domain-containing protein [Candidatus Contendobacter odensis]CDH46700.1 transposase [Candidatus Contendobacter odensis Run_B_J11]